MTLDRLADFPHRRVQLHRSLDTESSGRVVWQDADKDTPSSVVGCSIVDNLCAFEVLVTVKDLGGCFSSAHGVPVGDTALHDETDFGVVDPLPEGNIFVGNVCRQFLLGCQVERLKLSTGCRKVVLVEHKDHVTVWITFQRDDFLVRVHDSGVGRD